MKDDGAVNAGTSWPVQRLSRYQPCKEYAKKLQDWKHAARNHDWVGTAFKDFQQ